MYRNQQWGAALSVILMVVAIIAVLTELTVELAVLTLRRTDSAKFDTLQQVERVLNDVQIWLNQSVVQPAPVALCTNSYYCITEFQVVEVDNLNWWQHHAAPALALSPSLRSYALVRLLQQSTDLRRQTTTNYYQALVIAYTVDKQTVTVVQATFLKIFNDALTPAAAKPTQKLSWQQLR